MPKTIKDLSKKYKKSISFLNTILCRPEFNKFMIKGTKYKFLFDNSEKFYKLLKNIIELKK